MTPKNDDDGKLFLGCLDFSKWWRNFLKKEKNISIDTQLKIIEKQFTIINYLNVLTF